MTDNLNDIKTSDVVIEKQMRAKSRVEEAKQYKRSLLSEANSLSIGLLIAVIVVIVACIGIYLYMCRIPDKHVYLVDDADIFTDEEENELGRLAKKLSKDKEVNVLVYTTRNKGSGYSNSDEDCERFAGDVYRDYCISERLCDNSGFCLFVDLTLDSPGQRFLWIYTYGTAYYTIPDEDISLLFKKYKPELADGQYASAFEGFFNYLTDRDYTSVFLYVMYFLIIAIPVILAWIISKSQGLGNHALDPKPPYTKYQTERVDRKSKVVIVKRTVKEYYNNESGSGLSGGGLSGGGGFSGGGHSGGGGGRF